MLDDFGTLLRAHRVRVGRSRNWLAHEVGLDPSYLSRIELGERYAPREPVVDALARGLGLTGRERTRFRVAAGYAPVDDWDDALQAVVEVLTDCTLTDEEREDFRRVVLTIAARWRPSLDTLAEAR